MKRGAAILFVILAMGCAFSGQENDEQGPSNPKAQKTYKEALELIHQRMKPAALDAFKKADKQDDGKCVACQRRMLRYGVDLQDWKAAEQGAEELIAEAEPGKQLALAHYELGVVLLDEGIQKRKDEIFEHAHQEFGKALEAAAKFPSALYCDGRALALLKQDDAAKARFQQFVALDPAGSPDRQRALRYIAQPDLVRARLAPPFAVTTLDGQRISLDDLQGKVVLLDFWATWCAPCRAALPHVQQIVKKFQGRPFVVLSVSVDSDQNKWRDFVTKNEMTWPQYFDGGFNGQIAQLFEVHAIPHTFTIDSDGVLQDEQIGDESIEGKLKKLIKRAEEMQATSQGSQASQAPPTSQAPPEN